LAVSWLIPVPSGFIAKSSKSPVGLSTPGPVVRLLVKTMVPFFPGNAASVGVAPTSVSSPAA
jgi:hypothetical protein